MPRNVVMLLDNPEGRAMVKDTCKENGIHFAELQELVQAEVEQTGRQIEQIRRQNRARLWDAFDDILDRIQVED
ncbi:MAG: hypothetical protein GDA52_11660 [Rhodobacteraceae bacterium]|nr:hypothetical protein [Paracoccaceae bacterium]